MEEFLERIKIVEMKVSHLSKSPKKKAPQGQDADLDDEKEDLEGRLRSHFETAFTSALEKLESYGEIVSVNQAHLPFNTHCRTSRSV